MAHSKLRLTYLDTVSGLMLLYMIIYHCSQHSGCSGAFISHTLWLGFFMQWFFYKAGIVYRKVPFKENLSKSFNRLIVPWMIWNAIGFVIYTFKDYILGVDIDKGYFLYALERLFVEGSTRGNLALWFLTSLFAVRLIYGAIARSKYLWVWVLMFFVVPFFILYVVGNVVSYKTYKDIPYWISNISMGLVFYALGYRLGNYSPSWAILIALILAYGMGLWIDPTYVFMFENKVMMGTYALAPVFALVGIIIIKTICNKFGNRANVLSAIGIDTMPYYCMHWIVIEIVALCLSLNGTAMGIKAFYWMLGANVVLLPILTWLLRKSHIKYIFG